MIFLYWGAHNQTLLQMQSHKCEIGEKKSLPFTYLVDFCSYGAGCRWLSNLPGHTLNCVQLVYQDILRPFLQSCLLVPCIAAWDYSSPDSRLGIHLK